MASPKLPPKAVHAIGFLHGTFDLLHEGHRHLLRQARGQCSQLIVAIDSDRRAHQRKGPGRPVEDEAVRSQNLVATGLVSLVIGIDSDQQIRDAITYYSPDILFSGADGEASGIVGNELVPVLSLLPLLKGHSTTNAIKDLLQ